MSSNCFLGCPEERISQGKSTEWHVMEVNRAKNKDFFGSKLELIQQQVAYFPRLKMY